MKQFGVSSAVQGGGKRRAVKVTIRLRPRKKLRTTPETPWARNPGRTQQGRRLTDQTNLRSRRGGFAANIAKLPELSRKA
jgi:hypothetical protein